MPTAEHPQSSYEREQSLRLLQEQVDTSLVITAELMRIGVVRHLIDQNQRLHVTRGTSLVSPETAMFGISALDGWREIRGWWEPVEPFYHRRIESRWTLFGGANSRLYVSFEDPGCQLTVEQSLELAVLFEAIE